MPTFEDLSPRQRQIIRMLLEGKNNSEMSREIAQIYNKKDFSVKSVEKEMSSLFQMYDVKNRVQLAVLLTELTCTCRKS